MNNRVKELIRQAGGIKYDDDNNEMLPMLVGPAVQRFAELIVQECATVADDNFNTGFCPVGGFITDHFGIKE